MQGGERISAAIPRGGSRLVRHPVSPADRPAVLAAVALGWMVTSLLIEPATRCAAFPASGAGPHRA